MQRENSIKVRNDETYVIKKLVMYASNQGSRNADKLYMVYTKLIKMELSIKNKSRDELNVLELEYVRSCELLITKLLVDLMAQNIHYKTIYQVVKNKLRIYINTLLINKNNVVNNLTYKKS